MQNALSFFGRIAGLAVLLGCVVRTVHGAELPPVQTLQKLMDTPARVVRVYEPHLSVGDRHVAIRYVGYPAAAVFERILGKDWQGKGETVEFRALDGFVSRLPVRRFRQRTAPIWSSPGRTARPLR